MPGLKNKSPLEITEEIMKEFLGELNLLYAWNSIGTVKQMAILNRIKYVIVEVQKNG